MSIGSVWNFETFSKCAVDGSEYRCVAAVCWQVCRQISILQSLKASILKVIGTKLELGVISQVRTIDMCCCFYGFVNNFDVVLIDTSTLPL